MVLNRTQKTTVNQILVDLNLLEKVIRTGIDNSDLLKRTKLVCKKRIIGGLKEFKPKDKILDILNKLIQSISLNRWNKFEELKKDLESFKKLDP